MLEYPHIIEIFATKTIKGKRAQYYFACPVELFDETPFGQTITEHFDIAFNQLETTETKENEHDSGH